MKIKELRELSNEELATRRRDLKEEMLNLRAHMRCRTESGLKQVQPGQERYDLKQHGLDQTENAGYRQY